VRNMNLGGEKETCCLKYFVTLCDSAEDLPSNLSLCFLK
jgi:hypothetical protein